MTNKLRVLCLHGKQQTASVFHDKLHKMMRHSSAIASFEFLEAPYELPRGVGDDLSMRSWAAPGAAAGDYSEAVRLLGRRLESSSSLHRTEDDGCSRPRASHQEGEGEEQQVDVLFGFSQGCLVILSYLLMLQQQPPCDDRSKPSSLQCLRGVVLAGCPMPAGGLAAAAYANASKSIALPSLHIVGTRDEVTPPNASRAVADALFSECAIPSVVVEHPHAHSIPQSVEMCTSLVSWLESIASASIGDEGGSPSPLAASVATGAGVNKQRQADVLADVSEEVEMLQAIMGDGTVDVLLGSDDVKQFGGGARGICAVRVHLALMGEGSADVVVVLRLIVPQDYPATLPDIVFDRLPVMLADRRRWQAEFVVDVMRDAAAASLCGTALLLPLVMMVQEKLREALSTFCDGDDAAVSRGSVAEEADPWRTQADEDIASRTVWIRKAQTEAAQRLAYAAASGFVCGANGGAWELTIGLIGKPSAGKSTFFNAATDPESDAKAAKVAAFPFTTIEPNVGHGFYPSPCPCVPLGLNPAACGAEHGHVNLVVRPPVAVVGEPVTTDTRPCAHHLQKRENSDAPLSLHRRLPVTIKDVAGLVQGAYQGNGKGNQFLNDLCDADVLVHVVDGAAATDAEGATCKPGEGSALEDVLWVRDELHSWIFDNVRAKWSQIARRPERFGGMFSGYQAPRALVEHALALCGVKNPKEAVIKLPAWSPFDLHCFVACFVELRFPMVVALNKADVPSFPKIAKQLLKQYPKECFVPMSAKLECDLLDMRKRGVVSYEPGEAVAAMVALPSTAGPAGAAAAVGLDGDDDGAALESSHPHSSLQRKLQFLASHGGTGVHHVLRAAILKCNPMLLYPTDDIRTLAASSANATPSTASMGLGGVVSLPMCLVMKRSSTAEDAFRSYVRRLHSHRNVGAAASASSPAGVQQRDASAQCKLVRFEWVYVRMTVGKGGDDDVGTPSQHLCDAPPMPVVVCRKDEVLAQVPHALIRVMTNVRSH